MRHQETSGIGLPHPVRLRSSVVAHRQLNEVKFCVDSHLLANVPQCEHVGALPRVELGLGEDALSVWSPLRLHAHVASMVTRVGCGVVAPRARATPVLLVGTVSRVHWLVRGFVCFRIRLVRNALVGGILVGRIHAIILSMRNLQIPHATTRQLVFPLPSSRGHVTNGFTHLLADASPARLVCLFFM